MFKNKNINKAVAILVLASTIGTMTACKTKPEMGEMKVNEASIEEETNKKEKTNQEKLEFNIDEDILNDDEELLKNSQTPVIESISKYSDIVILPENIKALKANISMPKVTTNEEATLRAKMTKDVLPIFDNNATAQMSDAVMITTKTTDKNTDEDLSYIDIDYRQIRLGNEEVNDKLEEKIIGMKTGETKKFVISYPDDYYNDDLKGRTVTTYVKLFQIARAQEPSKAEVDRAQAEIGEMRAKSYYLNLHKNIKKLIYNGTEVKAYPRDLVEELREEFRNKYYSKGNKEEIDKNIKSLGEDAEGIKESEDIYVLNNIKEKLIILALSEKTGINRESELVKKYMKDRYLNEISDEELYDIMLEKILQ